MILCDSAQVADGKLYILGGGWSVTGPMPMPSAIAVKVEVDWHEVDELHHWEIFLVDEDGHPVMVETPEGGQALEVRGDFQVTRPEGLPAGSPVDFSLAINMGPLPLEPARRYTWKLSIDGVSDETWLLSFSTRPIPAEDE
ncbi:MAG TPA: hypothetical protein VMU77_07080 [Acidimicrobiales bacterium]|nr:hypothetical protein [Acidimicrobiales bacterium]